MFEQKIENASKSGTFRINIFRYLFGRLLNFFVGKRLAWSVLTISMVMAVAFWYVSLTERSHAVHERFMMESQEIQRTIDSRLLDYTVALRMTTAFCESIDSVSGLKWHSFTSLLHIPELLPQMQAIGFAPRVLPGQLANFVQNVRATTYSSYSLFPPAGDDEMYPVLFVDPSTPENQSTLGFDMHAAPLRRKAMNDARQSGAAAATPGIGLFDETEKPNVGFSLFAPVFSHNKRAHPWPSGRDSLIGYTFATFRFNELMHGILLAKQSNDLHFAIFDAGDRRVRLYDSDTALLVAPANSPRKLTYDFRLELGGRIWFVRIDADPQFADAERVNVPAIFLLCAVVVNSLLFLTLVILARARTRAEVLAEKLNDELRQSNERLEHLDQLKTEFLANASHELRTPLSIIREFVALVRDRITGEINPEQQECLDGAVRNCDRLADLIGGILNLQRLDAGNVRVQLRRVDLCQLLQDTTTEFGRLADKRGQTLELIPCADLPPVLCDRDRTAQILLNLIGNAVKFAPAVSAITISAKVDADDPRQVKITVSNTGVELSPGEIDRLFGRFSQLDEAPRSDHTGNGLGLAITKELVEMQGGRISVTSSIGEKTKLMFTLQAYNRDAEIRAFISSAHERSVAIGLDTLLFIVREVGNSSRDVPGAIEAAAACIRKTLRDANDECCALSGSRVILATALTRAGNATSLDARVRMALSAERRSDTAFEISCVKVDNAEEAIQLVVTMCREESETVAA